MANSFATPQTLPNPLEVGAGQIVRASSIADLSGAQNHAFALHRCHPVVSQSWPGGECARTNATAAQVAQWRVPYITESHTVWEIRVYGEGSAATVSFAHPKTDEVQSAALPAVAGWVELGDFTGSYAAAGGVPEAWDVLQMSLSGSPAAVYAVVIQPKGLTSPLAATAVDGFRPVGVASAAADHPLSAGRLRTLIENCDAMLTHPRVLFNWSGLENVDGPADASMPDHLHAHWVPLNAGTAALGKTYIVDAFIEPDPVDDTYLRVLTGRESGRPSIYQPVAERQITIAGGGAGDWRSTVFAIRDDFRSDPDFPAPSTYLAIEPGDDDAHYQSTADIRSLMIMGE